MGKKQGIKQLLVYVPEDLHTKLKLAAAKTGSSMSALITRLLTKWHVEDAR